MKILKKFRIDSIIFISILLFSSHPVFSSERSLLTKDGLDLFFSQDGDITGLKAKGNNLPVNSGKGGFYIKDMGLTPLTEFKNSGFETEEHWNFGEKWYRDWKEVHEGKWSVKLEMPGTIKYNSGELISDKISIEPEREHLLTFGLNIKKLKGDSLRILIRQYDQNGNFLKDPSHSIIKVIREPAIKEDNWFKVYFPFKTSKEVSYISLSFFGYECFGILWLDSIDISMLGDLESTKLSGKITGLGSESIFYQGRSEEKQIAIDATIKKNDDMIKVDGTVEDVSGNDRALILSFRMPIDARGWVWWDDIHIKREIKEKECYSDFSNVGNGRYFSKLPLSCINNSHTSLSYALPLDNPRIFRISYCYEKGYELEFDLGLSKSTAKFPQKASFSFLIYSLSPEWGMRSALKKYYQIFPEFFKKRNEREGIWFAWLNPEKIRDPEDFGLMFDETIRGSLKYDNRHKIYTFPYFEPFGIIFPWPDNLKKDSGISPEIPYSEVKERLEDIASRKVVKFPGFPGPEINLLENAINCAYHDENGRFYIDRYKPYLFSNPDPDIKGESYSKAILQALDYLIEKPQDYYMGKQYGDKTFIDGCYIDSIVSWYFSDVENYRKEQFKYADIPLVFSYKTRKPIELSLFTNYELISDISASMHQKGKLMLGNIWAFCHTYFSHLFDIIGAGEYSSNRPDSHYQYLRSLSFQKTLSFQDIDLTKPNVDIKEKEQRLKKCLVYGVFPGTVSWEQNPWEKKVEAELPRELYKKYIPLIQMITKAGWEPVTEAFSSHPEVLVERFGPSKTKDLYFTLRSISNERKKIVLNVNASVLGFSASEIKNFVIEELLTKKEIKPVHLGNSVLTPVEIDQHDAQLLHISSIEGHLMRKLEEIKTELTILSHGEISAYKTKNLLSGYYRTGGSADSIMVYFDDKENLSNTKYILMKNSSAADVVRLNIPKVPVKGGESCNLSLIYKTSQSEEGRKGFLSSTLYKIFKTLSYGYLPDMSIGIEFIDRDNKVLRGEAITFNEFIDANSWAHLDKNFIVPFATKELNVYVKLESNMTKLYLKDLRLYPKSDAAEAEKEMKLIGSVQSLLDENLRLKENNLISLIDEILRYLENNNYRQEDLTRKIDFFQKELMKFEENFKILAQSEPLSENKDVIRTLWRFEIINSIKIT